MTELTVDEGRRFVLDYIAQHPNLTYVQVGKAVGLSGSYVSALANKAGLPRRTKGPRVSKVQPGAVLLNQMMKEGL